MDQGTIGDAVLRVEDERFLTGRGRYTDDIAVADAAWGVVVRSPHPHARLLRIDTAAAAAAPGVRLILTQADADADAIGDLPCLRPLPMPDGRPMPTPRRPVLGSGVVRFIGEPVAFVVADTLEAARDAAELVEVDYDPLPAVVHLAEAVRPGAPTVHAECPDNRCLIHQMGDPDAVAAAFARAAHVVELDLPISRVQPVPMEPRAAIGTYDPATRGFTLVAGCQSPHRLRDVLAERIFRVPTTAVRVISPDLGGGFGNRNSLYPEYVMVLWAARRLGRPVRWRVERSESFLADDQGRDILNRAALALDADGRFIGLRVHTDCAIGGYLALGGPLGSVVNAGGLAGPYTTPAISVRIEAHFSHTPPIAAYRGFGRPEASYVIERLVDVAARRIGIDPADLRRRNMIPPQAMPYRTPLTFTYDSGDFARLMDTALDLADRAGFPARREAARRAGRLRGFGMAYAIESAGAPRLDEFAALRVDPEGRLEMRVGSHSHGQGHETVWRQILRTATGLDFDRLTFVQGDTDAVAAGNGTFGSRSAALAGGALQRAADRLIEAARPVAAHLLEAAAVDLEFGQGDFRIMGTDRALSLDAVLRAAATDASLPETVDRTLAVEARYQPEQQTFPNGCHCCEVEIDAETGRVRIDRYLVVDDFGTVLNPMIVEGQVHGGVVQGVGQILMENLVWDADGGQFLSGSFLDYAMPRADDVPAIDVHTRGVPTMVNALGVKGSGEAGCVGAMPCVANALADALAPLGIVSIDMPATPDRVWSLLRDRSAELHAHLDLDRATA